MGKRHRRKQTPDELAKAERKEMLSICSQILEVATGPTPHTQAKQWDEFIEINNLVKRIQAKQQNETLFTTKRGEHIEAFTAWVKENGVSMDKVKVEEYGEEGFGLQATDDIKADEVFLCIPRKVMITDENVKASPLGPLVKSDRILSTMPHVALALFLLGEKISDQSFWKPYIDFLPRHYSMPLYFNSEELQALKGSHTFGEALKQHKNIARQYAYFYKLFQTNSGASKLPIRDQFTYNSYRWAVCTIMSRQNQIPDPTGSRLITALIPKWDMCNHANGTITTGYNFLKSTSESVAERDFAKGEQLYIFYGARPNAHFLLYSGYVYPENNHDTIAIQLGVSKNDRLYAMKSQILAMLNMSEPSHTFYIQKNIEQKSAELWAFLRVFSMDEEQLKELLIGSRSQELMGKLIRPNCLVSKENERKVWSFLDVRLRLLQRQYQSSEESIQEGVNELSYNTKLCIKLRQCERDVLEKAIDHITLQKLRVEDLAEDALYYTDYNDKPVPEPPLASEEDSDITATNESRNSGEFDLDENPEQLQGEEDPGNADNVCSDSIKSDTESTLTNASELSQVATEDTTQPPPRLDQNHNPEDKSKDDTLPPPTEPTSAEDDVVLPPKTPSIVYNGVDGVNITEKIEE